MAGVEGKGKGRGRGARAQADKEGQETEAYAEAEAEAKARKREERIPRLEELEHDKFLRFRIERDPASKINSIFPKYIDIELSAGPSPRTSSTSL